MKHIAITAALATVALLGFNLPSTALTPQVGVRPLGGAMAFSQPEAVNAFLHDGADSYIVPIGKVLHLEQLVWALESSTHQSVAIIPGNEPAGVGDLLLKFSSTAPDSWIPTRPIRIVGDGAAGIRILNNGVVDWRDVAIFGYLQDS